METWYKALHKSTLRLKDSIDWKLCIGFLPRHITARTQACASPWALLDKGVGLAFEAQKLWFLMEQEVQRDAGILGLGHSVTVQASQHVYLIPLHLFWEAGKGNGLLPPSSCYRQMELKELEHWLVLSCRFMPRKTQMSLILSNSSSLSGSLQAAAVLP